MEQIFLGGSSSQTPVSPSIRSTLDAVGDKRADDCLLEVTDVALHVSSVSVEVEDRVADELSRGVVGGLAAAVRLDELDAGGVRDMELVLVRASADGDHGRVLEEDDRVRDRVLLNGCRERALELPRLDVRRLAERQQVALSHGVVSWRGSPSSGSVSQGATERT